MFEREMKKYYHRNVNNVPIVSYRDLKKHDIILS